MVLRNLRSGTRWKSKGLVVLPINMEGNHWTLLAFLNPLNSEPTTVLYFDSLGNAMHPHLRVFLEPLGLQFISHFGRVQYDGFQCGVWICWMVEQILSWLISGRALSDFSIASLVKCDSTAPGDLHFNASLIAQARVRYTGILFKAALGNSLLQT